MDLFKAQLETQVLEQQSRSIQNHYRTARNREFAINQPICAVPNIVFARQYLRPRNWVGGVILRRTGPLSYDGQVGDHISSKHSSQLLPNRAHHQDLSDQLLDQLYDDAFVQPEPEQHILPEPERNLDAQPIQAFPPLLPELFQVRPPEVPPPKVVIPKTEAKKPEQAPQQTLRDRGALKPAVRFDDEFDELGLKKSNKKT